MRFIDEVEIYVRAGDGGDGCLSFRREAHVPLGGPNGGDGGKGGDVILVATRNLSTLLDLRYQKHYKAKPGRPGQGKDMHGRSGEAMVIHVPCGTLVYDIEKDQLVGDLIKDGEELVIAKGGIGGRGNARFVTPTNRAPREIEKGEPGEELKLRLELKLLAEVGLVGLPSVGKSTLISKVSAAKPKIADYHFTTLVPNLGMVRIKGGERSFVMADIPGLIEGAAEGAGLGHRFLKHIERTQVLVYLLDDRHYEVGEDGDPLEDLNVLKKELSRYSEDLETKSLLVALNKVDILSAERRKELADLLTQEGQSLFMISSATGEGIDELLEAIWPFVAAAREERGAEDPDRPELNL